MANQTQNQGFPQINTPFVDPTNGRITQSWFKLILSLWNRTGAGQGQSSPYVPTNVAITGGTIDGTDIGGTTAASGIFTTLKALTSFSAFNFSGSSRGTNTGDQTITLIGDVTGTGMTTFLTTLAIVNSNVGTFTNATITVNDKGLITAASGHSGVSATIATAKLTTGGTNGSMTFTNGILTAQTPAT